MNARLALIAASILVAGSATAAPPNPPAKPAAQQSKAPAPVILASADRLPSPAPADPAASQPKPHRAARVTSCRCGGQVEEEQPEQ